MTTTSEALETLEHVKRKFAEARVEWRKREEYLLEELRQAKAETKKVEQEVEAVQEGPTPREIRDAALDAAIGVVDEIDFQAVQVAHRWAGMMPEERSKASKKDRLWAHPFVHAAIGVVRIKLAELKEKP